MRDGFLHRLTFLKSKCYGLLIVFERMSGKQNRCPQKTHRDGRPSPFFSSRCCGQA